MEQLHKKVFGQTANGESIEQYSLRNLNEMQVDIITYSARIFSLQVPDRGGD